MRLNILTVIVLFVCVVSFIWANNDEHASVPLMVFCLGALGAIIREQISSLSLIQANPYSKPELVYASPIVGGLLAIIFSLLLISGLLGGSFFPQFVISSEEFVSAKMALRQGVDFLSIADFYKLIAWSIVIGYSEKIVVNRLDQLAKRKDTVS